MPYSSPASAAAFRWRVATAVLITLALLGSIVFVWYTTEAFLIGFAGILLAIALTGVGDLVSGVTGLPRNIGIAAVLIFSVAAILIVSWIIAPGAAAQFTGIATRLPASLDAFLRQPWLQRLYSLIPGGIAKLLPSVLPLDRIAAFAAATYHAVLQAAVALFIGIALAFEPRTYTEGFLLLLPRSHRPRAAAVLAALQVALQRWLVGQLVSMAAVGTLVFLGLAIARMPFALALGILAGFLEFIPTLGPILAALPALLLAFLQGWQTFVLVLGVYVGVHLVENYILVPFIHRYTVAIPPVLAVVAFVLLGVLLGPLGLLLAMPLTATIIVLVRMLYVEDVLGEK